MGGRTKRVVRHKINDSRGLKGLNIGLTYILVGIGENGFLVILLALMYLLLPESGLMS